MRKLTETLTSLRLSILIAPVLIAACSTDSGHMGATDVASVIDDFCSDCHNAVDLSGNLSFDQLDPAHVGADAAVWEQVVRKLKSRQMPPREAVRPERGTYDRMVSTLETALDNAAVLNPGRPALRRLNRTEYANSIRDLLGLTIDVADLLPPDDSAFGFDNIGDLLGVSPALLERYLAAADHVSMLAAGDPATPLGSRTYLVPGDQSRNMHLAGMPLGTIGGTHVQHNFPVDAEYEFSLELFRNNLEGIRGLHHSHQVEIAIDGQRILLESIGRGHEPEMPQGTIITDRSDATDARLRVRVPVNAGEHTVTAAFIRKMGASPERLRPFDRSNANTYAGDGHPHLESITITGPFAVTSSGETAVRERIFVCRPESVSDEASCASEILSRLARRAYRRPVEQADLDLLMRFFEQGRQRDSFDSGIQFGLRRILASPSFVFRIEADPKGLEPGDAYAVSDIELASRLSFFLWSSLPDDRLIDLAVAGQLHEPDVLKAEVERLLADARADALGSSFAAQWLHIRNLDTIRPNTDYFRISTTTCARVSNARRSCFS